MPHAPEIALHVADEATELWQKTEEELGAIGLPPPFWAFAWAGGQALARYVLDHPEIVRGRRVLDFASGSGLVAIAAAKAGAAPGEACDIDAFAIAAIGLNAAANGVAGRGAARRTSSARTDGWDAVLAGDICYERDLAERVTDWLLGLRRTGRHGADRRSRAAATCRRSGSNGSPTYEVPVTRALEDAEVKRTSVWRFRLAVTAEAPARRRDPPELQVVCTMLHVSRSCKYVVA